VDEELFVVAETVERIEDCEVLGLVSVEGSGENDAVRNAAGKDFTGDGIALNAARGQGGRNVKEVKDEESGE